MMAQRAVDAEGDLWARCGIADGARVADVGCGPGAVLVELGRRVGPTGVAVGIEPDARARAAAEEEILAAGLRNCTVVAADGEHTGLEPCSQDVVMLRHVLFHVGPRAPAVVQHLARLLRPGGHLYVVDTDSTATRASFDEPDFLEQGARYADFQRARGNNVDIGPRLAALLVDAGLDLVEHEARYQKVPGSLLAQAGGPPLAAQQEMREAGFVADEDARRWAAARARIATIPYAALFVAQYLAVGRAPS